MDYTVHPVGKKWAVVNGFGQGVKMFDTNAQAWKWIDHNVSNGVDEGDHAGRQDWSIRQQAREWP